MDASISASAGLILDFIASKEAPNGYNTIFGNNQKKLTKQITAMTLDELIGNQSGFTKAFGSSASGRYQFMRDTLRGLKAEAKLSGAEIFTPDLQDKLALRLLRRRGFDKFMAGTLSLTAFGDQIAMEWASFPVLSLSRQGAHRTVKRGQTYYAGDGLNKVLIHPEAVEYILTQARDVIPGAAMASLPSQGPGSGPSLATVQHTASNASAPPLAPAAAPPVLRPTPPTAPAPTPRMGALDRLATWWLGRKA